MGVWVGDLFGKWVLVWLGGGRVCGIWVGVQLRVYICMHAPIQAACQAGWQTLCSWLAGHQNCLGSFPASCNLMIHTHIAYMLISLDIQVFP